MLKINFGRHDFPPEVCFLLCVFHFSLCAASDNKIEVVAGGCRSVEYPRDRRTKVRQARISSVEK